MALYKYLTDVDICSSVFQSAAFVSYIEHFFIFIVLLAFNSSLTLMAKC